LDSQLAAAGAARAAGTPRLVILGIELTGDLGCPQLTVEHETGLEWRADRLHRELEQVGLFHVLDNAPAQALITRIKSLQQYWHECNGRDVTWFDRSAD
jgi:hypothetical protein